MKLGHVPVPALGPNAYVAFSFVAFERMEEIIGEYYSLAVLADRIVGGDVPLIVAALAVALHDADVGAARVTRENLGEISGALVDAIFLSHYGRTVAEQAAHEERGW